MGAFISNALPARAMPLLIPRTSLSRKGGACLFPTLLPTLRIYRSACLFSGTAGPGVPVTFSRTLWRLHLPLWTSERPASSPGFERQCADLCRLHRISHITASANVAARRGGLLRRGRREKGRKAGDGGGGRRCFLPPVCPRRRAL